MAKKISVAEITGESVIYDVPVLDATTPLTDDTKMYLDIEKTFRQIPFSRLFDWLKGKMTQVIYPVGSVYMTFTNDNPANIFGGTWQKVEGKFLLGSSESYAVDSTGGEKTHVLTAAELPSHTHTATTTSSGSHSHSIGSSGGHTHTATSADAGSHNHNAGNSDSRYRFTINKTVDDASSGAGIVARRKVQTTSNGNAWVMTSIGSDSDINESRYTSTVSAHNHTITVNSGGSHTHTTNSAGSHTHNVTIGATGSGKAHNNMPPYQVVNIWRRVS